MDHAVVVRFAVIAAPRYEVAPNARIRLGGILADEGDDHAVEIEEEHDQVETELEEGFLRRQVRSCSQ